MLIDIGADIGLLGVKLLESEQVDYVWNVEISKTALEQARKLYEKKKLVEKASFIYSDGFKNLSFSSIGDREVVLVLAGFGTKTTLSILRHLDGNWLTKKLWLISLSHTYPVDIFKWAKNNNWTLIRENYFRYRKKIYPILLFSNYSECIARNPSKTELCLEYWSEWYSRMSKLDRSKLTTQSKELIQDYVLLNQKAAL